MKHFFTEYKIELFWTVITLIILLILKLIGNTYAKRVGRDSEIVEARVRLITNYVTIIVVFLGIGAITFIWGVNFKQLGILFSSVFAILGVVLFASWSILSNVSAGVILFFSFPFKIGDQVRIMDKDISYDSTNHNIYVIENIKAFHVLLRRDNGELLTYPNNLMLQKAVTLITTYEQSLDSKTDD